MSSEAPGEGAARNGDAGEARPAPRAIVAGHGDFAVGLVSAVAQITGRDDVFVAMSNRGLSADDVEQALRDQTSDVRVVFTDLPAGSWTIGARRIMRERPDIVLVTGANLVTLLDFVFSPLASPLDAARHAAERGRAALSVLEVPRAR
jgi:PTS system N-acetylgalactosamine-specific IIA component